MTKYTVHVTQLPTRGTSGDGGSDEGLLANGALSTTGGRLVRFDNKREATSFQSRVNAAGGMSELINGAAMSLVAPPPPPTPSENLVRLRRRLSNNLEACEDQLRQFETSFHEDPFYALEWGSNTMSIAAQRNVIHRVIAIIDRPEFATDPEAKDDDVKAAAALNAAYTYVRSETLRGAKYPASSTSPMSNMASLQKTAALAEMEEWLSFLLNS